MERFDFSGWATKANLKCSDGRTIMKDAFKHNDGQTVPLVWNHQHNDPNEVLGHALLENRDEGVYAYCTFNDTESGKTAKLLVQHGDVNALSIYANQLKQKMSNVLHGNIREVSLVLAGANPGASIDSIIMHGEESDEEAIIYTGEEITLAHSSNNSTDAKDSEGTTKENNKMAKLEGKVALITGAAVGLGEGISTTYAKYGAKCVLAARGPKVLELAEQLKSEGYEATGVQVDVSDYKSVERIVETAEKTYGKIDVLVCNAGVCVLEDFLEDDTFENRDLHLDINVKGAWNVAKAVIPSMIANGGGAIVVTSSVTGDMVADPGEVAYATSKAALVGFTKALAREFADKNIRVNAICPGYVRTPLVEGMAKQSDPENPERAIQAIADAVPLKRLADPEEVGELAAFLGCYESSYITGTQIVIDGGSTLPETTSMGQ